MKDNKKDFLITTNYDIGDKPFSKFYNKYVEIKGIVVSIVIDKYTISYTTIDNKIIQQCDLVDTKPLLDEYEKNFLRNLLIPLKAVAVCKCNMGNGNYYLSYCTNNVWFDLPPYEKESDMYECLELDKDYTLKELGIK